MVSAFACSARKGANYGGMNLKPTEFSSFDISAMPRLDSYKLLASVVLPRPIAWVTSQSADGELNAAPFSFFNIASSDPPILMLSFSAASDRGDKDTLRNIRETGEFVVNMVPEELAEAMNLTAVSAPHGVDEVALAGLTTAASVAVTVPRIAESPAALECRLRQTLEFGGSSVLLLGDIVQAHVRTDVFENVERLHLDAAKLNLIGRMHGGGGYTRTQDIFHLERKNWPLG